MALQETEDGLMRKCCRRALDLFTAEGNAQGTGGARCRGLRHLGKAVLRTDHCK